MATDVNATLAERGSRYGDFEFHAAISQAFEDVARATPGWARLTPAMKESLKLQWHKQARILNGDPAYADSWHDIGGYAKLVEDILARSPIAAPAAAPAIVKPVVLDDAPSAPVVAVVSPTPAPAAAVVPSAPPEVVRVPATPPPVEPRE